MEQSLQAKVIQQGLHSTLFSSISESSSSEEENGKTPKHVLSYATSYSTVTKVEETVKPQTNGKMVLFIFLIRNSFSSSGEQASICS